MPLTEFQEELASMSLAELRIYLRKLRADTFPQQGGQLMRKRRILNDIQKLETINKSSAGLEAVKVARKTMRKPLEFATVKADDETELRVPVAADPTFELPSDIRRKMNARKKKPVAPPTSDESVAINSPVVPEKPKKRTTTKKDVLPDPAAAAAAAAPAAPAAESTPTSYYNKLVRKID